MCVPLADGSSDQSSGGLLGSYVAETNRNSKILRYEARLIGSLILTKITSMYFSQVVPAVYGW